MIQLKFFQCLGSVTIVCDHSYTFVVHINFVFFVNEMSALILLALRIRVG